MSTVASSVLQGGLAGAASSSSAGGGSASNRKPLLTAIAFGVGVYYLWKIYEKWSFDESDDFPESEVGTQMSRLDLPSPLLPEDQRRPTYMQDVVSDTTCSIAGTYTSQQMQRRRGMKGRVRSQGFLSHASNNPLDGTAAAQKGPLDYSFSLADPPRNNATVSNNVSFANTFRYQPPAVSPILIVHGSESGTAKGYALALARELRLRGTAEVEVLDPSTIKFSTFPGWGSFVRTDSGLSSEPTSPMNGSPTTKTGGGVRVGGGVDAIAISSVTSALHTRNNSFASGGGFGGAPSPAAGAREGAANLAIDSFADGAFSKRAVVIFIAATYGEGGPCTNFKGLHEALTAAASAADHNPVASSFLCEGNAAVFALGSSAYRKFCQNGKQTADNLTRLGAQLITPLVCADGHSTAARPVDDVFDDWQEALVEGMERLDDAYRLENRALMAHSSGAPIDADTLAMMRPILFPSRVGSGPSAGIVVPTSSNNATNGAANGGGGGGGFMDWLGSAIGTVGGPFGNQPSASTPHAPPHMVPSAIAKLRFLDGEGDATIYPTPSSLVPPNAKRPLKCGVLLKRRLVTELTNLATHSNKAGMGLPTTTMGGGGALGQGMLADSFGGSPYSNANGPSSPSTPYAGTRPSSLLQSGGGRLRQGSSVTMDAAVTPPIASPQPIFHTFGASSPSAAAGGSSHNNQQQSSAAAIGELLYMSFDVSSSQGLTYQAGDHLSIYPRNEAKMAAAVLDLVLFRHLKLPAGEQDQLVAEWLAEVGSGGKKYGRGADGSSSGAGGGGGAIGEPAAASSSLFRNKHLKSTRYYFGTREGRRELALRPVELEAPTLNKARASGVSTFPCRIPLQQVFEWYLDLSGPPKKSTLRTMARCCRDPTERQAFMAAIAPARNATTTAVGGGGSGSASPQQHSSGVASPVSANPTPTAGSPTSPASPTDIPPAPVKRVYDYLLQYPSCIVPLDLFLECCPRTQPRRYSIASDGLRHPNEVHIIVKVVHNGMATRYLDKDVVVVGGGGGGGEDGLGEAKDAVHIGSSLSPSRVTSHPSSLSTAAAPSLLVAARGTTSSLLASHQPTNNAATNNTATADGATDQQQHDYVYAFISPSDFHLPTPFKTLKTKSILMIGPGTGIAPLLGFVHRRLAMGLNGGKDKVPAAKREGYSLEATAVEVAAAVARHGGGGGGASRDGGAPCTLLVGCRDFNTDCAVRLLIDGDPLLRDQFGVVGGCDGGEEVPTASASPRSTLPPVTMPIRVAVSRVMPPPLVPASEATPTGTASPGAIARPCRLVNADGIPNLWSFGDVPLPTHAGGAASDEAWMSSGGGRGHGMLEGGGGHHQHADDRGTPRDSELSMPATPPLRGQQQQQHNEAGGISPLFKVAGANSGGSSSLLTAAAKNNTTDLPPPPYRTHTLEHMSYDDLGGVGGSSSQANAAAATMSQLQAHLAGGAIVEDHEYFNSAGLSGVGGGGGLAALPSNTSVGTPMLKVGGGSTSTALPSPVTTTTNSILIGASIGGMRQGGPPPFALHNGGIDGRGPSNNTTAPHPNNAAMTTPPSYHYPSSHPSYKGKYVQALLREEASMVLQEYLLNPNGYVYVCGDALRMAKDVRGTFVDLLMGGRHASSFEDGTTATDDAIDGSSGVGMSREAAEAHLAAMERQGRYLQDIW